MHLENLDSALNVRQIDTAGPIEANSAQGLNGHSPSVPYTLVCPGIEGYRLLPLSVVSSCSKVPDADVRIGLELVGSRTGSPTVPVRET